MTSEATVDQRTLLPSAGGSPAGQRAQDDADYGAAQDRGVVLAVDADRRALLDGAPLFGGNETELLEEIAILRSLGGQRLVVTPNVDQALELESNEAWRSAYRRADLRIIDGFPIAALAKALGASSVQRNTGADLLPLAARESAQRNWNIVIAGGAEGAALRAETRLRETYPDATVDALNFPYLARVDDPRSRTVIEQLRRLEPDLVFLCLGSPKQELWFAEWEQALPEAVYIGAGAAVDFAARARRRAPSIVQTMGMEWAWRLAGEPRRLAGRYLVKGPRFLQVIGRSVHRHATVARQGS